MTIATIVDVAGGPIGGAARFRLELYRFLERGTRDDVQVIGAKRRVSPSWLLRRELARPANTRRVALNNISFIAPGCERWTLLGNALHFLTDTEIAALDPSLRVVAQRQAAIVRLAARRSDVLVVPCSAMAERVAQVLPSVSRRLVVRLHPVSAHKIPETPREQIILCPVIFEPYKHMVEQLSALVIAVEGYIDPSVKILVTASPAEVPLSLAQNQRLNFVGQLNLDALSELWARCCAIYFPSGLESFGYPLAEARANGLAAIARDTAQNREIAGQALCGFIPGDGASLRDATILALKEGVIPDPSPFDADAYFNWMLFS